MKEGVSLRLAESKVSEAGLSREGFIQKILNISILRRFLCLEQLMQKTTSQHRSNIMFKLNLVKFLKGCREKIYYSPSASAFYETSDPHGLESLGFIAHNIEMNFQ